MTRRAVAVILDRMLDDVGIALVGLGVLSLIYWLFVVEPRGSIHPDS
jgi:hypothetical protein